MESTAPEIHAWDTYGQELWAYWQGDRSVVEIIERDDGLIGVSAGPATYFAPYEEWSELDKAAIALARGRALDIGCGAGRHALYLQEQGLDVTGIDNSPLAVEICRRRGLRQVYLMSITALPGGLGPFDTVLMLGNNFGLFGSAKRLRRLLRRFNEMIAPGGRIVATTLDPHQTDNPDHLAIHARNRARGRLPGQVRIRVRYGVNKGRWFDYLFVSREEMEQLLDGTGWRVARFIDSDGPSYAAVIERA